MSTTDSIEKQVTLRAPVSRVWRAITDSQEFGRWFGVTLDGAFVEGQPIRGKFDMTFDETAIMKHQADMGLKPSKIKLPAPNSVFATVDRIQPEDYFSFRWIPYGLDAEADVDNEPTTLVEFRLEAAPEGTLLTIVESGFDKVPAHRRERAFRMNQGGWNAQAARITNYLADA